MSVNIVWLRRDLRISDNPALLEASKSGNQLLPIFILISVYIGLIDGWSPFIIQNRVGLHGKVFRMFKFRTMH